MVTQVNKTLEEALLWHNAGCSVIPLRKGRKEPPFAWKQYQIERAELQEVCDWFDEERYDVGVVTGKISGISVIDLDLAKGGKLSGIESVNKAGIKLPKGTNALIHRTSSGGWHVICKYDKRFKQTQDLIDGLDIRNDGGYIKVSGDNRNDPNKPSNNPYRRYSGQVSKECFADFYDDRLVRQPQPNMTPMTLSTNTVKSTVSQGSRNNALTSEVGKYKAKNMSEQQAIILAKQFNITNCNPPLSEVEVLGIVNSIYSYPATQKPDIDLSSHMVNMGEVIEEDVDWLWKGWLAKGKLQIFAGVEGSGKTFALLDIAISVARGSNFPDGTPAPKGNVLFFNFEDGLADTIKKRLVMLGHSGDNIYALDWSKIAQQLSLGDSTFLKKLKELIHQYKAELIIIDPLSSLLGGVNDSKETSLRPMLENLGAIATETKCAFALVKHFSKRTEMASATHNISGSIAYGGVVRGMSYIVPKTDDNGDTTDDIKVLANIKNSLDKKPTPLDFVISSNGISWTTGDPDFDINDSLNKRRTPMKREECRDAIIDIISKDASKILSSTKLKETLKSEDYGFKDKSIRSGLSLAIEEKVIDWKIYTSSRKYYSLPEVTFPAVEPQGQEGHLQLQEESF